MTLALLLLLAAMAGDDRIGHMDETLEVAPDSWREVGLTLRQRAAEVDCHFEVVSGRSGVRVALMHKQEAERLRARLPHRLILGTGFDREGTLRALLPPGDYAVIIDNRLEGREPAQVHLVVTLAAPPQASDVRELSRGRRITVIALSLGFFGAVALYAGRKIRRALRERPPDQPPPFWM